MRVAQDRDRRIALGAPFVVGGAVEPARRARMAHDELQAVRQRDRPPIERPAIELEGRAGGPARLGELIHQPALHPDIAVLRPLADPGQVERVDVARRVTEHRPCRGELDRRRG